MVLPHPLVLTDPQREIVSGRKDYTACRAQYRFTANGRRARFTKQILSTREEESPIAEKSVNSARERRRGREA